MVRIKQKISLSLLLAFVTSSRGAPVTYEYNYAPAHEYAPKDYSFSYGVKDLHTGDVKHQWEKKEGESVRGHYSLIEPDGSVRTVDYSADDKSGFNAVVKHQGSHYHPQSSKATSHNEFHLKESETPIHDYGLKELENTKSTISQDYEQHASKSYGLGQEAENEEETPGFTYIYVPQEGEAYEGKTDDLDDHEAEGSKPTVKFTTKDATKQPELPIDLTLIKPSSKEKLIPLDVSLLNPVQIDLSYKNFNATTNHKNALNPHQTNPTYDVNIPLSQEDYEKFLNEYYGSEGTKDFRSLKLSKEEYQNFLKEYYATTQGKTFARPYQDTGFRPTLPYNTSASPNTFRTNKRPATTPGLRNYSTGELHSRRLRIPKLNYLRHNNVGPVAFPDKRQAQGTSRLYRNVGNKFVRYAKRITSYESK